MAQRLTSPAVTWKARAGGLRAVVGAVSTAAFLTACPAPPPLPPPDTAKEETLATREALQGRREADLAQREALLSVREHAMAQREEAVSRREAVAGMTQAERDRLKADAQSARVRVLQVLASAGLDLVDADDALRAHLERGDALLTARDFTAARISYGSAEAFAHGTQLDEKRIRRRLEQATHTVQACTLPPGEKSRLLQTLLTARGRMADGAYKEALGVIKQVEDVVRRSADRKQTP